MDISSFSDDNFNALDWINNSFRTLDSQENKEVHVSSMVSKLQHCIQQVNISLEETSHQVLQNMPKVMHDTDMICKEALVLKDKMQFVKEEIAKIERGMETSMAALEKLDQMKTELQKSKQAIQEADNWTVLANDIEDVFESHNVDSIGSKIVSMQQSLVVLENSNDYENRKLQLEGYKNRLEAIVSPHLVKAFTTSNIDDSKRYVTMFSSIDRFPQLVKYYCKCEKGSLCQQWASIVELDQDHSVLEWLKSFYDALLSNWQAQVKWCMSVFKTCEMLPSIYCDVLDTLEENIVATIETALKRLHDHLPYLILLKEASKHFCNNMRAAILQQGLPESESVKVYWSAMSIYSSYISNYGALEEKHLLGELQPVEGTDLMDSVQSLGQHNSHIISLCRRALARSIDFTESLAFPALISALQYCLLRYTDEFKNILRTIEIEKSKSEEWTMFKVCLTLLQRIGELMMEVKELDQSIVENIVSCSNARKGEEDMRSTILSKAAQEEYNTLVQNVKLNDTVVLREVTSKLEKTCTRVYQCCINVMFGRISSLLETAKTWWSSQASNTQQMPDYSYAPLEYITQIGEYLMTLPEHVEPFVLREDCSLNHALSCLRSYSEGTAAADLILGAIARHTCTQYADLVLSLSQLSPNSAKQLSIDISYLGNVLEDIGYSLSENLTQICTLLKLPADTYQAQSAGFSPKLVASVRQLRNITAS